MTEVKKYIENLIPEIDNPRKLIGVAIDGFNIVFVRSTIIKSKVKSKKSEKVDNYVLKEHWDSSDTRKIAVEVLENLFLYFSSLKTKILNSETITEEIGLKGEIVKKLIKIFYELIQANLSKNKKFEKNLREKHEYYKFEEERISKQGVTTFLYACSNDAFYTMFNIGKEVFYPYLVVWRRMGNKMIAAVISDLSIEFFNKKKLIPTDTTASVPFFFFFKI